MAQVATLQEDSWQQVVCRICRHPFAILAEDAPDAAALLCQTCSILVDWFGQKEAPQEPAKPKPQPVKATDTQKRVHKVKREDHQQLELAPLLDRWGELWRSSEEQV